MSQQYKELSIIQKTHDFIEWFIPVLNRLPLDYKLTLGRRIMDTLYDILEVFVKAKYNPNKQWVSCIVSCCAEYPSNRQRCLMGIKQVCQKCPNLLR